MAKIVRLTAISLIARQIIRLLPRVILLRLIVPISPPAGRVSQGARPKFEHAMLFFFRRNGSLGFHCCQLRDILILFSTLASRLTENVDMAQLR